MTLRTQLAPRSGALLVGPLFVGCTAIHIPPPVDLGAPLPPGSVEQHGFDFAFSEHFWLQAPITPSVRAAGALPLGAGPFALELGGNLSVGWAGLTPALHWAPPSRAGSPWQFGGRLGLEAGSGDMLRMNPFADPFLGASLLGQVSRSWGTVGALTAALGWGYAGHVHCPLGCAYDDPGHEDPDVHWPNHSYVPFNGPTLHLRADLPVGRDGHAALLSASAQPLMAGGDVLWVWSLGAGVHRHHFGL